MTTMQDWQGRVGGEWARQWRRTDRSLEPIGEVLVRTLAGLAPGAGAVLDVGCGAGATALRVADVVPDARVLGLDVSPDLIDVARQRAASRHPDGRCRFAVADAADFDPAAWDGGAFDAIVSRHGVMFFPDPVAAFARLRALARHGAALVFSCFRPARDNDWAVALSDLTGQPLPPSPGVAGGVTGPFAFGDRDAVGDMLAAAGWRDAAVEAYDLPYVAGAGADPARDAADFFRHIGPAAAALRAAADEPARAALDQRLTDAMAARVADGSGGGQVAFTGAYWLWMATA